MNRRPIFFSQARAGLFGRVGDQSWQDRQRSERGVRRSDALQGLNVRGIIEHDATSAIQLQVDKSRCQNPAIKFDLFGAIDFGVGRQDRRDPAIFDQQ